MMQLSSKTLLLMVILVFLAACANERILQDDLESLARGTKAADYIVSSNRPLSAGFAASVARNGDTLELINEAAGFAVVRTANPHAYQRFADVVVRDVRLQWLPDPVHFRAQSIGDPPNSGAGDFLFDLQWGHTAVRATHAWNAGVRGQGVRVAVLDTGIDATHPDLAPNVNMTLSRSFVPGEDVQPPPAEELDHGFDHGTHVAGIIAAAQNDFGVIGVAPDAEIVAVKVLGFEGWGRFSWILGGMLYAADIDADIINMSLGGYRPRRGFSYEDEDGNVIRVGANEVAALLTAVNRAASYAYQSGTTIINAAFNDSLNSNETADLVLVPADAPHVISISATGPLGWALDPSTDLDVPAFYTNYGLSTIAFAAPGGNIDWSLIEWTDDGEVDWDNTPFCTVADIFAPCALFDLVLSTTPGGWDWAAGTSMAAPYASGIAALIISENGGPMHPAHVEAELRKRAADLGKPGKDAFYGHGRVSSGY